MSHRYKEPNRLMFVTTRIIKGLLVLWLVWGTKMQIFVNPDVNVGENEGWHGFRVLMFDIPREFCSLGCQLISKFWTKRHFLIWFIFEQLDKEGFGECESYKKILFYSYKFNVVG